MKKLFVVLLLAVTVFECRAQSENYDFNGDGKKETCKLVAPKTNDETYDCEGGCNCLIVFSDPKIPAITIENCIGGTPDILGDLDGNGTIEIGLIPEWWTSCWSGYHVFTLEGDKWVPFVDSFSIYACDEDMQKPLIKKDPKNKGQYIIQYYDMGDGSFAPTPKSVKRATKK